MLSKYSLKKAVDDKKISYIKVGNTNYFNAKDIEDFINLGKIDNGDE